MGIYRNFLVNQNSMSLLQRSWDHMIYYFLKGSSRDGVCLYNMGVCLYCVSKFIIVDQKSDPYFICSGPISSWIDPQIVVDPVSTRLVLDSVKSPTRLLVETTPVVL